MLAQTCGTTVKSVSMTASTGSTTIQIDPLTGDERQWVEQFIRERWGATNVVGHGAVYYPHTLPGFVAHSGGDRLGLLTYSVSAGALEIVTVDSLHPRRGIGTALIEAAKQQALDQGCHRLWLVTTNDNLDALRFYQKRGFTLVALHPNALERSRALKPQIPLLGQHGIPLRDEIELEYLLHSRR